MNKFLQRIKRQYLTYSRADRNALLILAGILLLVIVGNSLMDYLPPKGETDFSEITKQLNDWEKNQYENSSKSYQQKLFPFNPNTISENKLDSLNLPAQIKRNIISYRKAGGSFKQASDLRKLYGMTDSIYSAIESYMVFPIKKSNTSDSKNKGKPKVIKPDYFDPNKITHDKLKSFGLNDFQANNLVNYRSNGGVFQTAGDVLKIYGIDSALYLELLPFIKIDSVVLPKIQVESNLELSVELNSADSVRLMELPGIGPAYARRIIRYRELLGGYYSTRQLTEVYNFPEETYKEIKKSIYADTLAIRKLRINFLEYSELLRHPYLNKEQVSQILSRREKQGAYKNLSEVASLQAFDDKTFKRVRPYLTCR
ncbi:MAG: helix-hairpin-helix domain-containing protein [Draconibacterium sp.]